MLPLMADVHVIFPLRRNRVMKLNATCATLYLALPLSKGSWDFKEWGLYGMPYAHLFKMYEGDPTCMEGVPRWREREPNWEIERQYVKKRGKISKKGNKMWIICGYTSIDTRSKDKAHVKDAHAFLIFDDVICLNSLGSWIFISHVIIHMIVVYIFLTVLN